MTDKSDRQKIMVEQEQLLTEENDIFETSLNEPKKISWEEWKREKKTSDISLDLFNRPHWVGRFKGGNPFDFSGLELTGVSIFAAFAEGLTIKNAIFKDVVIEEGDFSRANFSGSTFINTRFNKTILSDACFDGAVFVNCNLNRVNLSDANFSVKEIRETVVYGISSWGLNVSEDSIQSKLIIEKTYGFYSDFLKNKRIPMMVDNIELAQFVYYLTDHKKMRDTINILNDKGVLLLGKFKHGGLERLYNLRQWFSDRNYMPMIFDFDRPDGMDFTETIVTMAGLSKLIVTDLSGDSVPHELHAILSTFTKPVIAYHDGNPYSMVRDLKRKNAYFQEISYDGTEQDLLNQLPDAVNNADKDNKEIILELANN